MRRASRGARDFSVGAMAAAALAAAARLRPSFRRVSEEEQRELVHPYGVYDAHLAQYGYDVGADHSLPRTYLRHVEPTEAELDQTVEYDMDEQGRQQ